MDLLGVPIEAIRLGLSEADIKPKSVIRPIKQKPPQNSGGFVIIGL